MAKFSPIVLLLISSFFIANIGASDNEESWLENVCKGQTKVVKLHFYIQDALAGPNATVFNVAPPLKPSGLGQIQVLDDVITAGPDPNSQVLGRAQGILTSSDLQIPALNMNLNFFFTAGNYSGSVLTILGRNPILSPNRELPVVAGTGAFRMARGYSISNTYSYDVAASYGVLEYTVYVALPASSH